MFKELEPLLKNRALTLTIAHLPNSPLICVTVIPTQISDDKTIDKAVLTPLSLDPATAEDLDAGLADTLASYTATFLTMQESVDQAKAQMEAALKAAKEETQKNAREAKALKKTTVQPVKPTASTVPPPLQLPNLFDQGTETPPSTPPTDAAPPPPSSLSCQSTEDEILAEVDSECQN